MSPPGVKSFDDLAAAIQSAPGEHESAGLPIEDEILGRLRHTAGGEGWGPEWRPLEARDVGE